MPWPRLRHSTAAAATIGVLGNGLGVVYPSANRALYDRVAKDGLLLTEFPPGERPHAGSFPRRNRLISGLSRVTVVVEAARRLRGAHHGGNGAGSGQGSDGGARATSPARCRWAPIELIRDGAAPVLEPDDLLQHFPELARRAPRETGHAGAVRPLPEALSAEERQLAELLGSEAIHPDQLAGRLQRPIGEVLGLLSGLEIAGVVEQRPGRVFRRV